MKKIRILGIGGQGIAFSGWLLGYAATYGKLYSAVHHSYGAEVRGGVVISNIVISDKPIVNPYIDTFDIYLILNSIGWRYVEKTGEAIYVADDNIAKEDAPETENIEWRPFDKISHEKNLPINVIALGYLAKKKVTLYENLKEAIIKRGKELEKNIEALKIGYILI